MKSLEKEVKVVNPMGIHARPASLIVQEAQKFSSDFVMEKEGHEVNGKSILSIMMLGAESGTVLKLRAKGGDAPELIENMSRLFENGFGER